MYKTIYIPVDNSDHSNTAVDVGVEFDDLGAAGRREFVLHRLKLGADDAHQLRPAAQRFEVVLDLGAQGFQFAADLVRAERGEALGVVPLCHADRRCCPARLDETRRAPKPCPRAARSTFDRASGARVTEASRSVEGERWPWAPRRRLLRGALTRAVGSDPEFLDVRPLLH